jgi:glucose/arabinose dehydrogenase
MREAFLGSIMALAVLALGGCDGGEGAEADVVARAGIDGVVCDPDNGGLTLPAGFCALVVHDSVGDGRHLVVLPNGDIYVRRRQRPQGPTGDGIVALRDTDGDGRADVMEVFDDTRGTGMAVHGGYLYASTDTSVHRYRLPEDGSLVPTGPREVIVHGLPQQTTHTAKSLVIDGAGGMWVNVGAPSNACAGALDRQRGARGQDPCPELQWQAGVWHFDADRPGQHQRDGERWASGLRNMVAIAHNPADNRLWGVQHNRDQLEVVDPDNFTAEDNAERPAEELLVLERGTTFSWPFCFYDLAADRLVLSPEYGGTGEEVGRCADFPQPVTGFPAHWAPNDMLFYTGDQLPQRYRNGVFVVFHGSWNRFPLPMGGYNVIFQPLDGTQAAGEFEVFAEGFAGDEPIFSVGEAELRPTGIAQGPDGSLYVSDSLRGTIWRIVYTGN